jgi:hypothetical protein
MDEWPKKNQYDDDNVIAKYVMARDVWRAVAEITLLLICILFKFYLYAAVLSVCFLNRPIDGDNSVCGTGSHFYKCYWLLSSSIPEKSSHPFKMTSEMTAAKCERIVLTRKLKP